MLSNPRVSEDLLGGLKVAANFMADLMPQSHNQYLKK